MTYDLLRLHQICSWYCIDLVMIQIHFDCKQKLALTSFLNGQTRPLFCLFLLFSHVANTNTYGINLTINDKSVDGVLGSQTRGGRMESADESTESTTKMVLQKKSPTFSILSLDQRGREKDLQFIFVSGSILPFKIFVEF